MEFELKLQQSIDEILPETLNDVLALSVGDSVSTEQVISNILIASHIRPTKLSLLSDLCKMIDESGKKRDFKAKMLRVFRKQVFRDPLKRGKEIINIEFYHTLFESSFISRESIESELELVLDRFNNRISVLGSFFLWFSEDFKEHQLFTRYKNEIMTDMIKSYTKNYQYKWKYDCVECFIYYPPMQTAAFYPISWEFILYYYNEDNQIEEIMKRDDVDSLQLISNNKDFDFNQRVKCSKTHPFLQFNPTLLQVAAFYGAIKCFKFMLLNGSRIEESDFEETKMIRRRGPGMMRGNFPNLRLLNTSYAVAGGNIEIIRIMEQHNLCFEGVEVNIASYFHHNDVFQWLVETKGLDITTECLYLATVTNNLSFFSNNYGNNDIYIIEYDEYDEFDDFDTMYFEPIDMLVTSKHVAVKSGFINIVKKFDIDPEEVLHSYHSEETTISLEEWNHDKIALDLAIKYNRRDIIKFFIPMIKEKEDVFYWAVYKNELDIVMTMINEYRYPVNMLIKGFRATEIANSLGYSEMEVFLRSCGGLFKPSPKKRIPISNKRKKIFYTVITVKDDVKSNYFTKISLDENVSSFVKQITKRMDVAKSVFEGKRLDPNKKLSHYNIKGGSVIMIAGEFKYYV